MLSAVAALCALAGQRAIGCILPQAFFFHYESNSSPQITLRIVPWAEVEMHRKDDYDDERYLRSIQPLAPFTACYAFDK